MVPDSVIEKADKDPSHYAWRCSICGADFPADGLGFTQIRDHGEEAHQTTPKNMCLGIVDRDTGEIKVPSYGPTVLKKARNLGYAADKGEQSPVQAYREEQSPVGEIVPIESARNGRVVKRAPAASATVLAKNVVLSETVMLLFHQAQAFIGYGDTAQEFSRFIEEFVMIGASEMGLDGAAVFSELVQDTVMTMVEGGGLDDYSPSSYPKK